MARAVSSVTVESWTSGRRSSASSSKNTKPTPNPTPYSSRIRRPEACRFRRPHLRNFGGPVTPLPVACRKGFRASRVASPHSMSSNCGNSPPRWNAGEPESRPISQRLSDLVFGYETAADIDHSGRWDILDLTHCHDVADVLRWITQTPGYCHSAEIVDWIRKVYGSWHR